MKPETTLKEALKPPFEAVAYPAGEYVADSNHQPVCCLLSNNKYLVYRGIVGLTKKFIVAALNEKWERAQIDKNYTGSDSIGGRR